MSVLRALHLALVVTTLGAAQQAISFPTEDGGLVCADLYGQGLGRNYRETDFPPRFSPFAALAQTDFLFFHIPDAVPCVFECTGGFRREIRNQAGGQGAGRCKEVFINARSRSG